jgi:hypothetical protein
MKPHTIHSSFSVAMWTVYSCPDRNGLKLLGSLHIQKVMQTANQIIRNIIKQFISNGNTSCFYLGGAWFESHPDNDLCHQAPNINMPCVHGAQLGNILVIMIRVWARQVRNYGVTASRGKGYFFSTELSKPASSPPSLFSGYVGPFLGCKVTNS